MIRWLDALMVRLGQFPTTQGRVVFTLVCVLATTVRYLGWGVPYRLAANSIPVVDGWGYWLLFLGAMSGLDVTAFALKRFSDTGYAAAKSANAPPAVNVEAPSQVTVTNSPAVQVPTAPVVQPNTGERGDD